MEGKTFAQRMRKHLDERVIKLQETEFGTDIDWPYYAAQVDFIKAFICAVAGYSSMQDVPEYKQDTMHDTACGIVDQITSWRRE